MNPLIPPVSRKPISLLTITVASLMLGMSGMSANAQTANITTRAATSSPGDWTQFLRDNMQRWNPYETVLNVNNVGSLGSQWSFEDGNTEGSSSPAVVNGVVYIGSFNGRVYALNASTGAQLWSFATGGEIQSSPAVANGVVYIGSDDHNVYALDASTGAKLWSYATGEIVVPSPTVANGVVYIGSDDDNVYALDASTGAKLWSYATNGLVRSTPAIVNGVVYVGSRDANVYALNANTGAKLWSYATGAALVLSSPAVANGVVYIGSDEGTVNDGNIYALNAMTGAKLWSYNAEGRVDSSPAVANGVVYVGSGNHYIYALNGATGALIWKLDTPTDSSPAVANGVVYIGGSYTGEILALNASTGAVLWRYALGAYQTVSSSPAVVNGVVYIGAEGGFPSNYVYAFAPGKTADLFLRIFPSTATIHQGDLLTYAFPVWNLGPVDAVHEVLNTQVPPGTTFDYIRISGTPGLGTCTTPPYGGTGQIFCLENSSMAANTTWTVRLTVKVTAPSGTTITENAATMSDTPDPNLSNNTATVSLKVQ